MLLLVHGIRYFTLAVAGAAVIPIGLAVWLTPDEAEAVAWYRKAAEQGYRLAQSNLGWCYDTGSGVWTVGSVAAGATATLTLTVTVDAFVFAMVRNFTLRRDAAEHAGRIALAHLFERGAGQHVQVPGLSVHG